MKESLGGLFLSLFELTQKQIVLRHRHAGDGLAGDVILAFAQIQRLPQ